MTAIRIHPAELAFAFSFAKVHTIIGWGEAPFLPQARTEETLQAWYDDGAARLTAAGRLTDPKGEGAEFSAGLTEAVLALVDPALVLMAERKEEGGVQRLTVHLSEDRLVGLTQDRDGMFALTRYADLAAAVAACAGFLGTAPVPVEAGTRIDTSADVLKGIKGSLDAGKGMDAQAALVALGAGEDDAASIVNAMSDPAAAGVLSVLYCADNTALSADAFSVMTTEARESWIIFPPGGPDGPMVIERSSASALTARVVIGVTARMQIAQANAS